MSPFVRLGVSKDADEAQIKRAYAASLRLTRPDEDPVGFQQLNDAYRSCLEWARRRLTASADIDSDASNQNPQLACDAHDNDEQAATSMRGTAFHSNAPTDRDAGLDPEPAFDHQQFLAELSHVARSQPAEQLERWLQEHPALYSLDRKRMLVPELVAQLRDRATPYLPQLDTVLRFFDLDAVHPHSAELQRDIAELRAQSRARGLDFRKLDFDRDPQRRGYTKVSIPWPTNPVIYVVAAMIGFTVVLMFFLNT